MHKVNMYYKKWKVVNGNVYANTEVHRVITNKGERVTGHNGPNKINIRRTFKKQTGFPSTKPVSYPLRRVRKTRKASKLNA